MDKHVFMQTCFICGSRFQYGPHKYGGRGLKDYGFVACLTCLDSNWDGWSPSYEQMILDHLKEKGLPIPPRNKKGLLPRTW